MAYVQYRDVNKSFGDTEVLHDINLDIEEGEFVVLVGPSGCGKSTTLRLVAGLEDITSGTISIGDTVVNDMAPKDRDIAMVFQNYALYPHMNVYDNMGFGLKLRKMDESEIKERVHEAAGILGIENLLGRKPKELSGGQRQRVALGRAIVRQPKVFLFDEPLSNLDAKLRVQMRREIKKLHATLGTTMIYVTHDQVEAMTMGDRIVVMKDGYVHQFDSPLKVYSEPNDRFVAGFIGSPSMNFIPAEVKSDGDVALSAGDLTFGVPPAMRNQLTGYQHQETILGIRPEDIHYADGKAESSNIFEFTVDVSEPMGNEVYLYFTLNGEGLVGRIGGHKNFSPNQQVRLRFDLEKGHLFNPESGERLQ
ncbi:MAG: sn-glycerol-3-phosphate import ATP-binding protein UgpC [Candidatus Marinimicrobia bacterium]|nr:sn-glycerol-3-phosphate import ATP-binding protein UgpC [Candidatus Neomarinimicrobiota bacterium]